MYYPLAQERPALRSTLSQQICALEVELYSLAPQIVSLERLLSRKAEIEKRLAMLRELEVEYEHSG